jgi:hypothetical protein
MWSRLSNLNLSTSKGNNIMRKFLALFIWLCVFFPLAVAAMTLTSIRPWVLDRAFYERIVSDGRIYDAIFAEKLPNQFNRQVFGDAEQLPVDALNSALGEVITPDYLRAQSVSVVNEVFDFIEGRDWNFEVSMDLVPIKVSLAGEGGSRFANVLAAALPACTDGQKRVAPGGNLARCIGDNLSVEETAAQIVDALPRALENVPDRIALSNTVDLRQNWRTVDWFLGATVRGSLDVAILVVIVTALIIGIVLATIGGDNLRGRLRWLGVSLFVPASLFVLMGISLATPFIAGPLRNELRFTQWDGIQYSEAFQQALGDLIISITQRVGSGFLLTGVVTCLIALFLIVLSGRVRTGDHHSVKLVQVPARNS